MQLASKKRRQLRPGQILLRSQVYVVFHGFGAYEAGGGHWVLKSTQFSGLALSQGSPPKRLGKSSIPAPSPEARAPAPDVPVGWPVVCFRKGVQT